MCCSRMNADDRQLQLKFETNPAAMNYIEPFLTLGRLPDCGLDKQCYMLVDRLTGHRAVQQHA